MFMDPRPSQQRAGLQHAAWQPQKEVITAQGKV